MITIPALKKKLTILLVEDEPMDVLVTKRYLYKSHIDNDLHIVTSGKEAIEFLLQKGEHQYSPKPDVIILDMGLPDLSGPEVMKKIRKNPSLRHIPIVILTGQPKEGDPIKKYHLFENSYVNKWMSMDEFLSLIKAVDDVRSSEP